MLRLEGFSFHLKCLAVRLCFRLEADVCAVTCILWEALLSITHHCRRMHVTCSWPLTLCCNTHVWCHTGYMNCLLCGVLQLVLWLWWWCWQSRWCCFCMCCTGFWWGCTLIVLICSHMGTCWYRKASVLVIQPDIMVDTLFQLFPPLSSRVLIIASIYCYCCAVMLLSLTH